MVSKINPTPKDKERKKIAYILLLLFLSNTQYSYLNLINSNFLETCLRYHFPSNIFS